MGDAHEKEITISYPLGNKLLAAVYSVKFPSKIGKVAFDSGKVSTLTKHIRSLKKILVEASPIMKRERRPHFGDEDNYEVVGRKLAPSAEEAEGEIIGEVNKVRYEMKDRTRTKTLRLTGSAWRGLYAILLLWSHPGPCWIGESQVSYTLPAGLQDDFAWALASQIRCVRQLEQETGLTDNSDHAIKTDDEYEAEAAKEPEEATA